jgi:hypothetical protein
VCVFPSLCVCRCPLLNLWLILTRFLYVCMSCVYARATR